MRFPFALHACTEWSMFSREQLLRRTPQYLLSHNVLPFCVCTSPPLPAPHPPRSLSCPTIQLLFCWALGCSHISIRFPSLLCFPRPELLFVFFIATRILDATSQSSSAMRSFPLAQKVRNRQPPPPTSPVRCFTSFLFIY